MTRKHLPTHGTTRSYTIGFILSIVLTIVAYVSVTMDLFSGWTLIWVITVLALLQLLVQLRFFLHLGSDSESRWNVIVFYFTLLVLFILVFGSLWIMRELDYKHGHQKSPQETEQYLLDEEQIKR